MNVKRHLHVACAIIERNGLVLAAQRSASMSLPLKWEFPGGKIEPGETAKECLYRELQEEMSVEIVISREMAASTHCYEKFTVTLHPFICSLAGGELTLLEHTEIIWLPPSQLLDLDWAEADLPVISDYLRVAEK